MAKKPVKKKATTRKKGLGVKDLPSKAGGKVKGGFTRPTQLGPSGPSIGGLPSGLGGIVLPTKPSVSGECNSNTLTCKDTSKTNTLCCE